MAGSKLEGWSTRLSQLSSVPAAGLLCFGDWELSEKLSPALLPFLDMVNWLGSLPSFLSISGSSLRRALMNQLHTWNTQQKSTL